MQLHHKWSRQHRYLLASVDVKNPQANFNDLENSVPPEESNDDLLDQARDDHTGESFRREEGQGRQAARDGVLRQDARVR